MKERLVTTDIQSAINACSAEEYVKLESQIYKEGLIIGKPVKLVGESDTIIRLEQLCIVIQGQDQVHFENITFEVDQMIRDAAFVISESNVTFKNVRFIVKQQESESFSCIWTENSQLTILDSGGAIESCFISGNHLTELHLKHNQFTFKHGMRSIDLKHVGHLEVMDNHMTFLTHGLVIDYVTTVKFSNNHLEVKEVPALKGNKLIQIKGLEDGELFEFKDNKFIGEMDFLIGVCSCQVLSRQILFEHNEVIMTNGRSIIDLSQLNAIVTLMHNKAINSNVIIQNSERLVMGFNELKSVKIKQIIETQIRDNTIDDWAIIEGSDITSFKKNKLLNTQTESGGVTFTSVRKLQVEKNQFDAHGVKVINDGKNQEVFIVKNVFSKCPKEALSFKALKVAGESLMMKIKNNIIMNNENGIHIDDPFIQTCHIEDNYFSQNKTAAVVIGGKVSKELAFSGNYFDYGNQIIDCRNAMHIQVMHNELNNSALRIRNAKNIMIHGNHIDTKLDMRETHDVCIKKEGSLIISENIMLRQKTKFEKRDVSSQLKITAFERRPSIEIFGNKVREELIKRGFFESKPAPSLALYPDESLKSLISHQIYANGVSADDVMIDDAMKEEFYQMKSMMELITSKINSIEIKQQVEIILRKFNVEIFAGKDQNDIYRFMLKSKETVELLDIYLAMIDDITPKTEKRILSILKNYASLLESYCQEQVNEEHDKLKAQMKLLENLL